MTSSGPNFPSTSADDATVGTKTWVNIGNITAEDGSVAYCDVSSATSHYLKATDFGFAIPSGATIDGIMVEWKMRGTSLVTVNSLKLVKGGSITGDEKSTGAYLPLTDTWVSYGGASDLWGLSWSYSDLNSSVFGAVLSAKRGYADSAGYVYCDAVRITVYYTEGGGGGGISIPVVMHHLRQQGIA